MSEGDWKKIKNSHKEKKEQRKKWRELKVVAKLEKVKKQKLDTEIQNSEVAKGRLYTVSIAVPSSIMENAQSSALQTYLAGQIARAAAVFNVDEIVVFDDGVTPTAKGQSLNYSASAKMCHLLQYLECPQYLRKKIFPSDGRLAMAGVLNPLDTPHHLRAHEQHQGWREGITLDKPVKPGRGSYVDCGIDTEVTIDRHLAAGIRVTVSLPVGGDAEFRSPQHSGSVKRRLKGKAVPPSAPRIQAGIYWGYTVRHAQSLHQIFTESPYDGGYDLQIGTSDKGTSVDELASFEPFKHMIVVFGGLQGLEAALETDEKLHVDDVSSLFNYYLNTCPNQGSRTIRTEEAVLVTMSAVRRLIQSSVMDSS